MVTSVKQLPPTGSEREQDRTPAVGVLSLKPADWVEKSGGGLRIGGGENTQDVAETHPATNPRLSERARVFVRR